VKYRRNVPQNKKYIVELKLLAALQAVLELEPMAHTPSFVFWQDLAHASPQSSSPQLDPAEVGLDNQPKEIEKAFKRLLVRFFLCLCSLWEAYAACHSAL